MALCWCTVGTGWRTCVRTRGTGGAARRGGTTRTTTTSARTRSRRPDHQTHTRRRRRERRRRRRQRRRRRRLRWRRLRRRWSRRFGLALATLRADLHSSQVVVRLTTIQPLLNDGCRAKILKAVVVVVCALVVRLTATIANVKGLAAAIAGGLGTLSHAPAALGANLRWSEAGRIRVGAIASAPRKVLICAGPVFSVCLTAAIASPVGAAIPHARRHPRHQRWRRRRWRRLRWLGRRGRRRWRRWQRCARIALMAHHACVELERSIHRHVVETAVGVIGHRLLIRVAKAPARVEPSEPNARRRWRGDDLHCDRRRHDKPNRNT